MGDAATPPESLFRSLPIRENHRKLQYAVAARFVVIRCKCEIPALSN